MKKVYVLGVTPDPGGPSFGRIMRAADFQKSQDYAHAHIIQIAKDLLVAGAPGAQVAGFNAAVAGGRDVAVQPGSIVDAAGVSYELDDVTTVTVGPADPALPRIDLIYATVAADVEVDPEFRPFRRLRTPAEEEAGTDEFPQTQYNQPTELHSRVTLAVKAGAPNAVPVAPVAGAGETPLWRVHVAAAQTVLVNGDLTDVRVLMKSLYQALVDILALQTQVGNLSETIDDRVAALLLNSPSITRIYDNVANTLQLFVTDEALDDRVAALVIDTTSVVKAYDDAANTLGLSLHSTYKSLLDNATSAATASALMKRDASGDVQSRDFKPTRQVLFPDSSVMLTPRFSEQQINIFDLENYFSTAAAMVTVVSPSGVAYYVNLLAADFVNIPLALEVVMASIGINTSEAQLYNVTDSAVLASCFSGAPGSANPQGIVLVRSPIFNLSGSGRKRLQVRLGCSVVLGGNESRIYAARIIAYPAYASCGSWAQSACSV